MSGWISASWRAGLLLSLAATLPGCGGTSDSPPDSVAGDAFSDYMIRLGRVLEAPPPRAVVETLPAYPDRRRLRLPVVETDIDVADFVEIHRCDMGELVGFRNSPLGRVQLASQRLGYETAWLAALSRCDEPPAWMQSVALQKTSELPALFWNATFAARELHVALGDAAPPAVGDLAYLLRGLGDALTGVERGDFDLAAFEEILSQLRSGSWVGPARRQWAAWRRYLEGSAALLDEAGAKVCLNGRPTPRSRRLVNVFRRFYLGQLQPDLARVMGRQEAWVRQLGLLVERLSDVVPGTFTAWYAQTLDLAAPGSEWSRTRLAVVSHAQAWQRLFATCGLEPGAQLGED